MLMGASMKVDIRCAQDMGPVGRYIRQRVAEVLSHRVLEQYHEQIKGTTGKDYCQVDYVLELQVFTPQELEEYVQYRINEAKARPRPIRGRVL